MSEKNTGWSQLEHSELTWAEQWKDLQAWFCCYYCCFPLLWIKKVSSYSLFTSAHTHYCSVGLLQFILENEAKAKKIPEECSSEGKVFNICQGWWGGWDSQYYRNFNRKDGENNETGEAWWWWGGGLLLNTGLILMLVIDCLLVYQTNNLLDEVRSKWIRESYSKIER